MGSATAVDYFGDKEEPMLGYGPFYIAALVVCNGESQMENSSF